MRSRQTCRMVKTIESQSSSTHHPGEVDIRVGNSLIVVKRGVDSLRAVRTSLMQVAYSVSESPEFEGVLVLVNSPITVERLREEWEQLSGVLRKIILNRLTICLHANGRFIGIPRDPTAEMQQKLAAVIEAEPGNARAARTDYAFIILKLLIGCWLKSGKPVTSEWLARTAGCSYPSVARALRPLGSLLERQSDRRVALRWFPREEFVRMLAGSARARSTARFADQSGPPRSLEAHIHRLEKLKPAGLAIGGVLGAKHYCRDLDLVGSPRLDLSLHCSSHRMNLDFIEKLDPALKRVEDPLAPSTVIVHAVRHADPLFVPRRAGLAWADPVECLFDLHEAHLDVQAAQFLEHLQLQLSKICVNSRCFARRERGRHPSDVFAELPARETRSTLKPNKIAHKTSHHQAEK